MYFLLSTTYLPLFLSELQNDILKESNEKKDYLTSELEDSKMSLQINMV